MVANGFVYGSLREISYDFPPKPEDSKLQWIPIKEFSRNELYTVLWCVFIFLFIIRGKLFLSINP